MINTVLLFAERQKSVEEALGAGDELAYFLLFAFAVAIGVGIWAIVKKTGRRSQ